MKKIKSNEKNPLIIEQQIQKQLQLSYSHNQGKLDYGHAMLKKNQYNQLYFTKVLVNEKKSWVQKMTKIHINSVALCENAIKILMSVDWPNLNALWLKNNQIEYRGIRYIVQANMPELAILNLSSNSISDEGAKLLSKANWPLLKWLILLNNRISDEGIYYLTTYSYWPNLRTLNLKSNYIATNGALNFPKLYSNSSMLQDFKLYGNDPLRKFEEVVYEIIPTRLKETIFINDGYN